MHIILKFKAFPSPCRKHNYKNVKSHNTIAQLEQEEQWVKLQNEKHFMKIRLNKQDIAINSNRSVTGRASAQESSKIVAQFHKIQRLSESNMFL